MKVAKVYDIDDIRIEDVPVPDIGPRDALVQMKRCGICSGDVTPWYIRRKAPIVIGHEPAGVIAAVGAEVEEFKPGDRVFIHHHAPCFRCRLCRRGFFTMCPTWKRSQLIPGGMAEYVKVPELNLRYDTLKLPDAVSFDDAALIEPAACSVKAITRAGVRSGETVLIIGLGFMGQVNALVARYFGAKMIIGADMVPYRLDRARALGADATINVSTQNLNEAVQELTGGTMADVVIVGPGSIPAMKSGLACAGKGSTVLFFMSTPEHEVLDVKPYDLYFNEISIVCSYSCGPYDTRAALDLVEMGVVTAEKLVTHRFPLQETAAGFRKTAEANDSLKTLIVIEEESAGGTP